MIILLPALYDKSIQIINILDLEKYIPGTVEAEGGSNTLTEYYKAQAVISRTFAVKNFTRHAPRDLTFAMASIARLLTVKAG